VRARSQPPGTARAHLRGSVPVTGVARPSPGWIAATSSAAAEAATAPAGSRSRWWTSAWAPCCSGFPLRACSTCPTGSTAGSDPAPRGDVLYEAQEARTASKELLMDIGDGEAVVAEKAPQNHDMAGSILNGDFQSTYRPSS